MYAEIAVHGLGATIKIADGKYQTAQQTINKQNKFYNTVHEPSV